MTQKFYQESIDVPGSQISSPFLISVSLIFSKRLAGCAITTRVDDRTVAGTAVAIFPVFSKPVAAHRISKNPRGFVSQAFTVPW